MKLLVRAAAAPSISNKERSGVARGHATFAQPSTLCECGTALQRCANYECSDFAELAKQACRTRALHVRVRLFLCLHHFLGQIIMWSPDIEREASAVFCPSFAVFASVSSGPTSEVMCEKELIVRCFARWKSRSIANKRAASEDAKGEFVVMLNGKQGQLEIFFFGRDETARRL